MDALLRRRQMMLAGGSPTPSIQPVFHKYLVFDGDACIETDIVFPANCSIKVFLGKESLHVNQGIFNAGDSTNGSIRLFLSNATTKNTRNIAVFYDSTAYLLGKDLSFSSDEFNCFITPNGYGWGTLFYSYTKGNNHPNAALAFGTKSGGQRYTGSMRDFLVYGSDAAGCQNASAFSGYTPVITLKPCTYNGENGLWCVETSTFYGNTAGVGQLSVMD